MSSGDLNGNATHVRLIYNSLAESTTLLSDHAPFTAGMPIASDPSSRIKAPGHATHATRIAN